MKTLFRILGTAAAVAVTGAAIVALDKILNQKDPLHVEEVEFPEEAEQDAAEAEKDRRGLRRSRGQSSGRCRRAAHRPGRSRRPGSSCRARPCTGAGHAGGHQRGKAGV